MSVEPTCKPYNQLKQAGEVWEMLTSGGDYLGASGVVVVGVGGWRCGGGGNIGEIVGTVSSSPRNSSSKI